MEKNSKKDRFVFDTSALISLAITGLIDKISGIAEIIDNFDYPSYLVKVVLENFEEKLDIGVIQSSLY